MESAAVRSQLPAISIVENDKAKREEEAYQPRHAGANSAPGASPAEIPSYHYAQGPPPPYTRPSPQHGATAGSDSYTTPPGSRRPSGEKEAAGQSSMKQSLPSISEALGVDNQASFQPSALSTQAISSSAPPPILALQTPVHNALVADSPIPTMRTYVAEPPRPHGDSYGQYQHTTAPPPASPKHPMTQAPRPLFPDIRPALHLSTTQPTHAAHQSTSFAPASSKPSPTAYDRHHHVPAGSFVYGYAAYPPQYQSAATSSSRGPVYAPSSSTAPPSWKSTRREGEESHGDSVKRHLDQYDLETALNDITGSSSVIGDFAQRYSNLLHQAPRTGPAFQLLPNVAEVEDMIVKSRAQTEYFIKIRETVLAQQAAHDQEAAEQRQRGGYNESNIVHSGDSDDGRSNFSSADAKKRRGRAAPPGRCHSCNRAETPEWRRGPDGARTLCNACGLHYAKLTRKQNNAGKIGSGFNSSHLRPKEQL